MPVVAGNAVRLREAYLEAVQARAEYAERSREEEARHRVSEERMRIARELHDVVAHHLALAHAQAGTAAHLAGTHPEHVRKILTELAGTTSSALREMKGTVGLLRQPDDPGAPLTPSPGLTQLADLTRAFGSAGLTVTVTTEGEPRPLSPGVDLTAYRIVQEALTNVSKHTTSRSARVRLRYSYDRLTVTVTDDGVSAGGAAGPAPGRGVGLTGMREGVRLVGGGLRTGRRGGGDGSGRGMGNAVTAPGHGFGLDGMRKRARSADSTLQAEHPAARGDGASAMPVVPHGFGLIGMRERARSVGGVLQAGHRVEGGFEVTTELPLYPSAPESAGRTS